MGKYEKLLQRILTGTSDRNINFSELCQLLKKLGFEERVRGDHYIFTKDNVEEIINIQPKGNKAKGYQVRQVRNIIVKYGLGDSDVS
jgi:predicted RNA binding protein YcfA (HicA-like mRNA interferase family)